MPKILAFIRLRKEDGMFRTNLKYRVSLISSLGYIVRNFQRRWGVQEERKKGGREGAKEETGKYQFAVSN